MKILFANPNTSVSVTDRIAAVARAAASPGTEIVAVTGQTGVPYIATRAGNVLTTSPPYTMIVPVTEARGRTPRDMMTGTQTLPVLGVLRELVARGIVPVDSYVCGFEFGFEIGRNSGRAILNNIEWKWL